MTLPLIPGAGAYYHAASFIRSPGALKSGRWQPIPWRIRCGSRDPDVPKEVVCGYNFCPEAL
jgi:hypothetical protein